jgi:hypothetical protein
MTFSQREQRSPRHVTGAQVAVLVVGSILIELSGFDIRVVLVHAGGPSG